MSDLQCAATVMVVRHGDAEPEDDPQGDGGGSLTTAGRAQARRLGESLVDRAVSVVYCSGMTPAVQTAEIAAGVLGAAVRVRTALRESSVGGGASGELEAISDLHRGETVLVVSDLRTIGTALPRLAPQLAGMPSANGAVTGACEPIELKADSDGWVVAR